MKSHIYINSAYSSVIANFSLRKATQSFILEIAVPAFAGTGLLCSFEIDKNGFSFVIAGCTRIMQEYKFGKRLLKLTVQ